MEPQPCGSQDLGAQQRGRTRRVSKLANVIKPTQNPALVRLAKMGRKILTRIANKIQARVKSQRILEKTMAPGLWPGPPKVKRPRKGNKTSEDAENTFEEAESGAHPMVQRFQVLQN